MRDGDWIVEPKEVEEACRLMWQAYLKFVKSKAPTIGEAPAEVVQEFLQTCSQFHEVLSRLP